MENTIKRFQDDAHLIGMIPIEEFLRFGFEVGLNESTKVLDLCCGYGTVLKAWSEAFGVSGVGVDRERSFLAIGRERLARAGIEKISLVEADVTAYRDDERYDVVLCSETIGTIEETLALGERFLRPGGLIGYQKLYSRVDDPPEALVAFDGEVLPMPALHERFSTLGYAITSMALDTPAKWAHYVLNWNGKRLIDARRRHPEDEAGRQWMETWYRMYFEHRMRFEGQALFGLEKVFP